MLLKHMERKAITQKNTLLKNAQANAECIFFKRVFFSPSQIKLFFKISQRFKNFLKRNRTVLTWTDLASNVIRFVESVC